jgi:hypothetical protein
MSLDLYSQTGTPYDKERRYSEFYGAANESQDSAVSVGDCIPEKLHLLGLSCYNDHVRVFLAVQRNSRQREPI